MRRIRLATITTLFLTQLLVTGCASSPPVAHHEPSIAAPVSSDAEYANEIRQIEEYVARSMKAEGVVGLTIGFVKDDYVWVRGFGLADLENGVPAKPESSYRMASVNKPMTAVGVLTLVEDGRIDLDAEVQQYVPYFPRKDQPITIRQLLGHLGGISHYRNYDLEGHFKEPKDTREAIAVFEDFDLVAEPGTEYNYTSYGFNLLGAVIEGASGQSYGEYMTEHVWQPLSMNDTRMDDPLAIIPNRVEGYQLVDGELKNSEYVDISSRFAAGGIRSTVPDMLNFAKGLYEGKLLKDETRSRMWTSQSTRDSRDIGYGFGWGTNTANGRFVVGHGGAQAETRTYLLAAPNENFAAAVAINFENANSSAYVFRVFEIVMKEPWAIRYWARSAEDGALIRALDMAFDFGMRQYDQFGAPLTKDPAALHEAFDYFNDALAAEPEEAEELLERGVHPAADRALVAMVSHMADTLASQGHDLDGYYRSGVLPLFRDYIAWTGAHPDAADGLVFNPDFEGRVRAWSSDWERTWTAETRNLVIDDATDLSMLTKKLGPVFEGASVYPDYSGELEELLRTSVGRGDMNRAFAFAKTAVALYPDSDDTTANLAILYVVTGDMDHARPLIRKSLEIAPNGGAGPANLNRTAYSLAEIGQIDAGLRVLMAAIDIHPDVANLYDSVGELYNYTGQSEKAIEYYTKALEIDPSYPNAENARKILEELKGAD